MAYIRNLAPAFSATHISKFPNLLVSGCSFTFNNSYEHVCSWPYYLRDLARFENVIDCSQSAAGSNHIFNSVINEIENDNNITPENTIVVIAWSGLTRTDVIASNDVTRSWHNMSHYDFNDKFSTLSILNYPVGKDLDTLCKMYKTYVDVEAQILESAFKIIALKNYLENKNFNHVFAQYQDLTDEINYLDPQIKLKTLQCFDNIESIGSHSKEFEPNDGHPTPNSYLSWTKDCLIPYLVDRYPAFIQKI